MKKKVRSVLRLVLTVVFLGSLVVMGLHFRDYYNGEADYKDAADVAGFVEETVGESSEENIGASAGETSAPADTSAEVMPPVSSGEQSTVGSAAGATAGSRYDEKLKSIDLKALREINPDVIGWINIPRTGLSYPLMQTQERDEYLYKAWDGSANDSGSIFLEKSNRRDFSDLNTIVYGHLMYDGSMFGSLKGYQSQDYRDRHPYIYIATADGIRRYEVFAAYEAKVNSDTYRLYFEDDTRKQVSVDAWVSNSLIKTDVIPSVEDSILTLSTCMGTGQYSTRWVVQAVLCGWWESVP